MALAWTIETGETQLGLRLAGSLNFLWQISGSLSEGPAWLGQLLALPGANEPTAARAQVLVVAARLAEILSIVVDRPVMITRRTFGLRAQ